ncbi:MAG: amidase [Candidatus Dormibacteraeota bacterium]|uniref:Amidase n=1 Tax=Candidatus Aeolococcus gillhamiae TaxID=3127015 RepID=A0A2W6A770_9BACT|nr:amidase [Candidatus Dormibacteraeota bacterium]PZR79364.1 MAG: amidase [Candidatus Dormibacter sp. RRmetagenome_bin12]
MATFITRLDSAGPGPRVAVKDIIDVAGVPTTAGCRAVQATAQPARRDAACLRGTREASARIVGKTNLHELAVLPFGTNPWFGTPVNPLDPALLPGGSSSGSAVAVATGEADVAFGSDTGGSVRIPSACCGVCGLKTTHGRVALDGVWPLAPSLDTIGPIATGVAGLDVGMRLLEPGFVVSPTAARVVGRVRSDGLPDIEAAVNAALRAAELEIVDVELPGWAAATDAFTAIYLTEFWASDHHLLEDRSGLGDDTLMAFELAELVRPTVDVDVDVVRRQAAAWRAALLELFDRVELLALPTLPMFPPRLDELGDDNTALVLDMTRNTALFNLAGTPCTAQPVPLGSSRVPASLQLVGPPGAEELLLPTAAAVESAVAR